MRLFAPTASRDILAMIKAYFSCSVHLAECLVWRGYLLSDNVVTSYNKQTYICHPFLLKGPIYNKRLRECVSLLRLRAEFQSTVLCCTENLFLPIQHLIVGMSVGVKWVDKARGHSYCSKGCNKKSFHEVSCDVGLCVKQTSFEDYHTKAQL
jgi:hypothetical protein